MKPQCDYRRIKERLLYNYLQKKGWSETLDILEENNTCVGALLVSLTLCPLDENVNDSFDLSSSKENDNMLLKSIQGQNWVEAIDTLYQRPHEAKTQLCLESSAYSEEKTMWSLFPLHASIISGAPFYVIMKIINAYPDAVRKTDCIGALPIHYAASRIEIDGDGERIFKQLLRFFPCSAEIEDTQRRTPLEIALKAQLRKDKRERNRACCIEQEGFEVQLELRDAVESISPQNVGLHWSFVESIDATTSYPSSYSSTLPTISCERANNENLTNEISSLSESVVTTPTFLPYSSKTQSTSINEVPSHEALCTESEASSKRRFPSIPRNCWPTRLSSKNNHDGPISSETSLSFNSISTETSFSSNQISRRFQETWLELPPSSGVLPFHNIDVRDDIQLSSSTISIFTSSSSSNHDDSKSSSSHSSSNVSMKKNNSTLSNKSKNIISSSCTVDDGSKMSIDCIGSLDSISKKEECSMSQDVSSSRISQKSFSPSCSSPTMSLPNNSSLFESATKVLENTSVGNGALAVSHSFDSICTEHMHLEIFAPPCVSVSTESPVSKSTHSDSEIETKISISLSELEVQTESIGVNKLECSAPLFRGGNDETNGKQITGKKTVQNFHFTEEATHSGSSNEKEIKNQTFRMGLLSNSSSKSTPDCHELSSQNDSEGGRTHSITVTHTTAFLTEDPILLDFIEEALSNIGIEKEHSQCIIKELHENSIHNFDDLLACHCQGVYYYLSNDELAKEIVHLLDESDDESRLETIFEDNECSLSQSTLLITTEMS